LLDQVCQQSLGVAVGRQGSIGLASRLEQAGHGGQAPPDVGPGIGLSAGLTCKRLAVRQYPLVCGQRVFIPADLAG
jgi:hypothetical protein